MKKISKTLQNVNSLFNYGKEQGVLHLVANQKEFDGRQFSIDGYENPLINFMSNNYLGIGDDPRVKQAAIEGIQNYGIHASLARTYLMFEPFLEFEQKLEQIFGYPALVSSNTTMSHLSYMPIIIGKNDAIILDHLVHKSVMLTAQFLRGDGYYVETVRHNQMDLLENRIKALSEKYEKVWYLADSVYSMHGDIAPFKDISTLLYAYEKFHCYIDDAHGMSWIGQNGKGLALHLLPRQEKFYISTSLNKSFGGYCSAMIFPDNETKEIVRNCGAPLTFSAHTPFSAITAGLKIAEIHLSEEIYEKQMILNDKISKFKKLAKANELPIISYHHTPIFYLGLGNPDITINLSKHLMQRGFIVSVASTPAVPFVQSGVRISMNVYQTDLEIKTLIEIISEYVSNLESKGLFSREEALKGFKLKNNETKELEVA